MQLFVCNLPYAIDEGDLWQLFAQFGEITDLRLVTDRETGKSRGFGFVTFANRGEAERAIEALDASETHGRRIVVRESQSVARG